MSRPLCPWGEGPPDLQAQAPQGRSMAEGLIASVEQPEFLGSELLHECIHPTFDPGLPGGRDWLQASPTKLGRLAPPGPDALPRLTKYSAKRRLVDDVECPISVRRHKPPGHGA